MIASRRCFSGFLEVGEMVEGNIAFVQLFDSDSEGDDLCSTDGAH